MALRRDHYEHAFADYLHCKGWPYVAVDESRRKAFGAIVLKSFDFVVYSQSGPNLLIDVKGRKFPDTSVKGRRRNGRAWENWITRDDVEGLTQWQSIFGDDFRAVLVFTYWLQGPPEKAPFEDIHFHDGRHYAFAAIGLTEYTAAARPRSARWHTLTMGAKPFRLAVCDVAELL